MKNKIIPRRQEVFFAGDEKFFAGDEKFFAGDEKFFAGDEKFFAGAGKNKTLPPPAASPFLIR